jgi:hypothetical protein
MLGTIARKIQSDNLIEARRVTFFVSIVLELELELVLDPNVEFLLNSSPVTPMRCS